jgi:ADP-ribose pyrophosphatase YjhB (NUDIX family)
MNKGKQPQSIAEFLEELRSIAQLGLCYTQDPYDRERYERLLELAAVEYGKLSGLPDAEIGQRFRAELGHVTPKVGVDAAVFSRDGRVLLIRRVDDNLWCLPCGWAELGETPEESIRREVWEETGIEVEVESLIDVFTRLPGASGPHTSYHLLYHCIPTGGALSSSAEASKVGYHDYRKVTEWHVDHRQRAERAYQFWLDSVRQLGRGRED